MAILLLGSVKRRGIIWEAISAPFNSFDQKMRNRPLNPGRRSHLLVMPLLPGFLLGRKMTRTPVHKTVKSAEYATQSVYMRVHMVHGVSVQHDVRDEVHLQTCREEVFLPKNRPRDGTCRGLFTGVERRRDILGITTFMTVLAGMWD